MRKIRVLIAEDSLTVRKYLVDVLQSSPEFDVIGEAENGKRAIELCSLLRPDVVTMDMMMPLMTGVAATEYIMAYCPTPILVVSASTNRGELFKTYEALSAGALDVLEKPNNFSNREWPTRFLSTVRMVSRIRVITHPRIRLRNPGNANGSVPPVVPSSTAYNALWNAERADLIAIGASTGGPAALAQILGALPADFPVPTLIVIHIAEPFAPALAEWLATQSRLPVRYARDGEAVPSGPSVLLAPATHHLVVQNHRIHYSSAAPRHSCKPSVDVLFESLADAYGSSLIACLLTGMGKDGATGLLQARNAGALTIAQDENTSVVYGMPGEAARIGAAERILPLEDIAPAITAAVRRAKGKQ